MKVIIISGPPASGKTTIGKKLSSVIGANYASKDMHKEYLFDTDGRSNVVHSKWYEDESRRLLWAELKSAIESGTDIIIESNFTPKTDSPVLEKLLEGVDAREIYITASGRKIFYRFVMRRERHPEQKHLMHHDRMWYGHMAAFSALRFFGIDHTFGPLKLSIPSLRVDTSDFSKVDMHRIITFCK